MASTPQPPDREGPPAVNLGLRLRTARQRAGLSLRELARRLGVSPSFMSQVENGKAQPSVATLYSLSQMLEVSIDHLFEGDEPGADAGAAVATPRREDGDGLALAEVSHPDTTLDTRPAEHGASETSEGTPVRRSDLGSLQQVWRDNGSINRLSITTPGSRTRLVMDTGVIWEQLATNTAHQLDFMEITYPPGSSSTVDERMLRHDGFEYGYLLEGELEVTLGFDVFTLRAGQAVGMDSSVPHLLRNRGTVAARGIWFVHHRHD